MSEKSENFHPILEVVKKETPEGNLYLFPEYSEYADHFRLSQPHISKTLQAADTREGLREILLINNPDLLFQFVAKEERPDDNKFRIKYKKQGHNLTLREILIGRSLSQLATYEDDEMAVKFEEPIGYHENNEGNRVGLFKYIPQMAEERMGSKVLNQIIEALKDEMNSRLKKFKQGSYEYSTIQFNYWNLMSRIEQIYFSGNFGRLIMNKNGIRHNEFLTEKDGYYEDPETKKRIVQLIDFELCSILDQESASAEIKKQIQNLIIVSGIDEVENVHQKSYVNLLHEFLGKDLHQALPADQLLLLLEFEDAFFSMKRRIARALQFPSEDLETDKWKYFQPEQMGPAFPIVHHLPKEIDPLIAHSN